MLKNKLLFGATALVSAITLVGCSGKDSTGPVSTTDIVTTIEQPVTVEFWHSMSGAFTDTINEIVEEFNETVGADKGITVNAVYQGGYEDVKSKTIASIKAGNSPEIVQGTVNSIMEYTQSGFVQPLDDYIFNEEVGINDFDDIYEVYRQENSGYDNEGTYYSLPFAKSTDLLFYNKTLFDEHGLTIPTTWEELELVSEQITEITGKPALSIDNLPNYLITYLFQHGADYTNKDGEILFNNETSVEALELLKNNIDKGIWRIAGEDKYSSAPFLAEHTFMYIGSSAGEGFLNEDNFKWSATTTPQVDVENPKYIQQGSNVAILNQNNTSEEVLGAFEFVKYLCSSEVTLKWAMNTGYLPLRESVANSDEYKAFIEETNSKTKLPASKSVANGFVEAVFNTDSYNSNMVRNEVGVMVEDIILGGMDVQKALDLYEGKLR